MMLHGAEESGKKCILTHMRFHTLTHTRKTETDFYAWMGYFLSVVPVVKKISRLLITFQTIFNVFLLLT